MASKSEVENKLNSLIDERASKLDKKLPFVKEYVGVCTGINANKTINVRLSGSTVDMPDFPNRTLCDITVGQGVVVHTLEGDLTNAYISTVFGSQPPNIGYHGAYLNWQNGLICTKSDNSAQIKINSEVGLLTSVPNGTGGWKQTGGLTPDGYSFFNRIVNPDVPGSYATIGFDQASGSVGLEMFKKINNIDTSIGQLFFNTDSEVPEMGGTSWILDDANYIGIYKTFSAGDLPTRMEFNVAGHEIMEIQTNWIHIDGDLTVNNLSVNTVNAVTLNSTNLQVTGSKNCVVKTQDNGTVAVNSYETAEYYFGDLGEDTIKNNVCIVNIEPIFKQTVNTDITYQVFLTPYGNGNIWVDERTSDHFTVKGDNINFGWEIKAKRKNYEDVRLTEVKMN